MNDLLPTETKQYALCRLILVRSAKWSNFTFCSVLSLIQPSQSLVGQGDKLLGPQSLHHALCGPSGRELLKLETKATTEEAKPPAGSFSGKV